ncbi:MAG: aerobic carbon-monoxide dehydrogenase small subunit [Solirubrobacteraceae bacterium]|jgi:carbon-monoxide dehydrogenase small subunit|nr:aerobic carbon-monoxide dehydrogenase small subunit [Solirubrobacteraceae bacterium]
MLVSMTINGQQYSHDIEPRLLLVHYIREYAELHGTHWGCDTSNCGICIVLFDGEPVKSCTTLAAMAEGHEIVTVEGMANPDGSLSSIQMAFHEMHALQCGFCTPGMMSTARWLIDTHPNPTQMTDHEIRDGISGNLCRCTGYDNIVKAIRWSAAYEAEHAGRS